MTTDPYDDEDRDTDFTLAHKNADDYYKKRHRPSETISQSLGSYGPSGKSHIVRPYNTWTGASEPAKKDYQITRESPKPKDNSILSHIFALLMKKSHPIHISEIISHLDRKGKLKGYAQLHLYSTIHKLLCRNNQFFAKSDKSFFAIRDGLKKRDKTHAGIGTQGKITFDEPSIIKMVETALKEVIPKGKATSSEIYLLLKSFGFSGDYPHVRKVLKDKRFKRRQEMFSIRHP